MKTFCLGNLLKPSGFYFTFVEIGLGYVYVIYDDGSSWPFKKWTYPSATLSNPSIQRFADESGPRKTKETFLDSSEMGRAPIGSSIGLCLTRGMDSRGQGSHVWISQSRPSCTAFSVHRLRCAAAFLVMEAGQKKPRARFSHCWRTLSIRQPAGQKRAAIPAGCRQGKGASWFGSDAWSVDDALSHGD